MAAAGRKYKVKDRPRAIVVLIAVFVIGCLSGWMGSSLYYRRSADLRIQDFRDRMTKNGQMPRREPANFRELLSLTPEQYEQFTQILSESRKQMTEFRKQTDAFRSEQDVKIKAIISEMNSKLISVLNEEQKKKFAAWQKEFESRRERSPRRRDFPPPQ